MDLYEVMADDLYSRQDLARLSGVSDDVLGFWLKRGLLVSETDGGEGRKHRRFTRDTVKIAAILRGARSAGLNIEALSSLAKVFDRARQSYREFMSFHPPLEWMNEIFDSDDAGDLERIFAHYAECGGATPQDYPAILKECLRAYDAFKSISLSATRLGWLMFRDKPERTLFVWKDEDIGWLVSWKPVTDGDRFTLAETDFAIALSLQRLLMIDFD